MIRTTVCCAVFLLSLTSAVAQSTQSSSDCADIKAQVTRLETRLRDWPALGRYRDANTKVNPPAKGEHRVVFMGDSITDSWDDPKYGGFLILAGTNDLAGNTGPSTLETIEANLTSMAELARASGIRVVLASILPVSDYEKTKDGKPIIRTVQRPPEKIRALNDWMKTYAAKNKSIYLDYYSSMIDEKGFLKDELSEDGLHPDAKGYAVMAPLAEQAIAAALKKNVR